MNFKFRYNQDETAHARDASCHVVDQDRRAEFVSAQGQGQVKVVRHISLPMPFHGCNITVQTVGDVAKPLG